MTQLLDLMLAAPDIQEEVLFAESGDHRNICGGIVQSVVQYIAASEASDGFLLASSFWPFLGPKSHSSPRFVSILLSPQ